MIVGKNIAIATIFLAIIAFMALAFRPGSVNTVGQGGGYSMGGENEGDNWGGWNGGGERDDDD
ncbi:hypothetical protein [Magnetovibrio sp.]|uniref:hypothetical protein n=1 Tax=Magnetovibrio sp. TaxID=2024836 RepID=UPI002F951510